MRTNIELDQALVEEARNDAGVALIIVPAKGPRSLRSQGFQP